MPVYDFDTVIDRRGTNCLKYDFAKRRGYPEDVLPLWVADMDFPAAPEILDALHRGVSHGIFGYSETGEEYYEAVAKWFSDRYGFDTQYEWLVKTPGVVFALSTAVRAFTEEGDAVLIQPPVYYPFFDVVRSNGRRVIENELRYSDGHYEIDFDDLEEKLKTHNVKLFIFCSPHNPVGRVWTREELRKIGELCERYDVLLISDEIHCDFAFDEHPHSIFLQACPELEHRVVVCTAPSKSFNLAGLQISNNWIPDPKLRRKFRQEIDREGYSEFNTLGIIAAQAAYEHGGEWLAQCRKYLRGNLDFLREYLAKHIPQISLVEPEGTYFAWLDLSQLGLDRAGLRELIVNKARLWLDAGHIFGERSEQFQRIVLACPRSTLERALTQLDRAINT